MKNLSFPQRARELAAWQFRHPRVAQLDLLSSPQAIIDELPATDAVSATVAGSRNAIRDALHGRDGRLVLIVGPCSIHDTIAAHEYAERLAALAPKVAKHFHLVMRVYFEKPRTTIGWKGLITDPHLDGSDDIETGLRRARELLLWVTERGIGAATELLDPIVPPYLADLVVWAAIGARTTESQTHRQMASGLSMPVGFKNSTDGGLQTSLDALQSASRPHSFLGIDPDGRTSIVRTTGNSDVHLVLRGGERTPNFSAPHIAFARVSAGAGPERRPLMVDCSHGNSGKDFRKQPAVFLDVIKQVAAGERSIVGAMLESHINEGSQKLTDAAHLKYGVSITDGCLGWADTERTILEGFDILEGRTR